MIVSLFIIVFGIPALFMNNIFEEHKIRNNIEEYKKKNKHFDEKIAEQEMVCPHCWNPYRMMLYRAKQLNNI